MLLDIRLRCDHSAYLLISNAKPVAVPENVKEKILSKTVDGITVLAEDRGFAESLLSLPEMMTMIHEVVIDQKVGLVEINLKPGWLTLHSRPTFILKEAPCGSLVEGFG